MAAHADSDHDHGVRAEADRRYLGIALGLIVAFMAAEIVVALIAGSIVLLADAGHMLTDALAIAASLWAISLAARPATEEWTYGLKRAEILSAAANGITLLVVASLVTFESIRRLVHPPHVHGGAVLGVALAGVAVNLTAAWVLARANRESLNVEGSFQHIVTDVYAFVGTAIAGVVILTTGFGRADPIASLVVVGLMLRASWSLLHKSGRILLQGTPDDLDLAAVRAHLLHVEHIIGVHDLHAWSVSSGLPSLSAHIVVGDDCFEDGHAPQLLDEIQSCLAGHFDVEHSTFQFEPESHLEHEPSTHE